jgi:hypothetical protein
MYKIQFYTTHRQFYVCDKSSPAATDSDNFWTMEAVNDRLAMEEGIVGVGTECYGPVKAEIYVLDAAENQIDYDNYDHIVEGGVILKSGRLQVLDCPDSEIQFEINLLSGNYRIRVYSSNLSTVVDDEGDDFYKIEIWPSNGNMERKVLKKYTW